MMNCGRRSVGTESVMKTQAAALPHTAKHRCEYTHKKLLQKRKLFNLLSSSSFDLILDGSSVPHSQVWHHQSTAGICMWESIQQPKIHPHCCDIWKTDGARSCDMWSTAAGRSSVNLISARWCSLRLCICHNPAETLTCLAETEPSHSLKFLVC